MTLRRLSVAVMVLILGSILPACDYGRMNEQEAVQTYRVQLPPMPERTIPISGGVQLTQGRLLRTNCATRCHGTRRFWIGGSRGMSTTV